MTFTREDNVAEDVTQETFLRAISDTKYQGNSSLYTYLCGIAKHVRLDYLKKHKRTDYVEPDKLITQSADKTVEEMLLGKSESWARVTYHRATGMIIERLKER